MIGVTGPRMAWTPRDEAQLKELVARKERVMVEFRERLTAVLAKIDGIGTRQGVDDDTIDSMIANAAELREALVPFDPVKTL